MNFYPRFPGDYQRDTAHLSLTEHGAYAMLLDAYYATERPFAADLTALYRIARATTDDERAAVDRVAAEYFPPNGDGLRHNGRADREIAAGRVRIDRARSNGRRGGRPPKGTEEPSNNPAGLLAGTQRVYSPSPSPKKKDDDDGKPSGLTMENPAGSDALTALNLTIWANGAVTSRWGEQVTVFTPNAHSHAVADACAAAGVEGAAARASIIRQCAENKGHEAPGSVAYFRRGILQDWQKEQQQRVGANGAVPLDRERAELAEWLRKEQLAGR